MINWLAGKETCGAANCSHLWGHGLQSGLGSRCFPLSMIIQPSLLKLHFQNSFPCHSCACLADNLASWITKKIEVTEENNPTSKFLNLLHTHISNCPRPSQYDHLPGLLGGLSLPAQCFLPWFLSHLLHSLWILLHFLLQKIIVPAIKFQYFEDKVIKCIIILLRGIFSKFLLWVQLANSQPFRNSLDILYK